MPAKTLPDPVGGAHRLTEIPRWILSRSQAFRQIARTGSGGVFAAESSAVLSLFSAKTPPDPYLSRRGRPGERVGISMPSASPVRSAHAESPKGIPCVTDFLSAASSPSVSALVDVLQPV